MLYMWKVSLLYHETCTISSVHYSCRSIVAFYYSSFLFVCLLASLLDWKVGMCFMHFLKLAVLYVGILMFNVVILFLNLTTRMLYCRYIFLSILFGFHYAPSSLFLWCNITCDKFLMYVRLPFLELYLRISLSLQMILGGNFTLTLCSLSVSVSRKHLLE